MAWLYQQRGSKQWWIGYRFNGRQFLRSTKTADRAQAEKCLAQVRAQFELHRAGSLTDEVFNVLTGSSLPSTTLLAAIRDWLAEAEAATGQRTFAKYSAIAAEFALAIGANEQSPLLREVRPEHVRSFLVSKRAGVSASTTNHFRKILSSFFLRCVRNGMLRSNPMVQIREFKAGQDEKQARRAFTLAEVQLMYRKAPRTDEQKKPDTFWPFMILGGFYTGLRMGDLITLRIGAVDLVDLVLRVKTSKTGAKLEVPLRNPLLRLLTGRIAAVGKRKPSDFLWPERAQRYLEKGPGQFSADFYELVMVPCGFVSSRANKQKQKNGRKARRAVTEVTFHCLRHTFVSLLKSTGSTQAVAKELAGHSSDQISDIYTHTQPELLRQAIAQLPEVCK